MSPLEEKTFIELFRKAYERCFTKTLTTPLSETDSKHFSNEMLEQTGLVIGWKTIKNYSFYVLNHLTAKQENPSVATLDTFARYVAGIPKTDETSRKRDESHFPYWYAYQDSLSKSLQPEAPVKPVSLPSASPKKLLWAGIAFSLALVIGLYWFKWSTVPKDFADNFSEVSADSLAQKGWLVKNQDEVFWEKRNAKRGCLTLFTLEGDSYPDQSKRVGVQNLLMKEVQTECFSTEIHFSNFIPNQNWQQAGLLLMEDTTLLSRSVRLTISYNNFFGGYDKPGEILLQAISSINGGFSKPEEIAHVPLFSFEPGQDTIIQSNLRQSALRIEKNGHHFRFLYATGSADIFAFKEVVSRDLVFTPRYVGIFGLKGFVKQAANMPIYVDFFSVKTLDCEN